MSEPYSGWVFAIALGVGGAALIIGLQEMFRVAVSVVVVILMKWFA